MPEAIYPSKEECRELANRFFAGQKSFLPDGGWSALTDEERTRLVEDRMASALKRTEEGKASQSSSMFTRLFNGMRTYVDRNNEALIRRLPEFLERDLSAIVKRALDNELHFVWERQSEQAMRQAERLDNICAEMSKIKSSDGKSRMQAMDLYLSELQSEMRRLGEEVAELKARLR